MTMGTKVYTKQCMYSLKQSHGDFKKNMLSTCFLRNVRIKQRRVLCYRFTNMKDGTLFWYV